MMPSEHSESDGRSRVVVTTGNDRDATAESRALDLIEALSAHGGVSAAFASRYNSSSRPATLSKLLSEHNAAAILVVDACGTHLRMCDETHELRLHGGLGVLRVRNILQGGGTDNLCTVCQLKPGDVFVDGTAGLLQDSLVAAAAVGPTGRVIAIEASPLLWAVSSGRPVCTGHDQIDKLLNEQIDVRLGEAADVLSQMPDKSADVVYFDPMFAQPTKASPSFGLLRRVAFHKRLSSETIMHACRVARKAVVMMDQPGGAELERLGMTLVQQGQRKRFGKLDCSSIEEGLLFAAEELPVHDQPACGPEAITERVDSSIEPKQLLLTAFPSGMAHSLHEVRISRSAMDEMEATCFQWCTLQALSTDDHVQQKGAQVVCWITAEYGVPDGHGIVAEWILGFLSSSETSRARNHKSQLLRGLLKPLHSTRNLTMEFAKLRHIQCAGGASSANTMGVTSHGTRKHGVAILSSASEHHRSAVDTSTRYQAERASAFHVSRVVLTIVDGSAHRALDGAHSSLCAGISRSCSQLDGPRQGSEMHKGLPRNDVETSTGDETGDDLLAFQASRGEQRQRDPERRDDSHHDSTYDRCKAVALKATRRQLLGMPLVLGAVCAVQRASGIQVLQVLHAHTVTGEYIGTTEFTETTSTGLDTAPMLPCICCDTSVQILEGPALLGGNTTRECTRSRRAGSIDHEQVQYGAGIFSAMISRTRTLLGTMACRDVRQECAPSRAIKGSSPLLRGGGHLLLCGPPGNGKRWLLRRLLSHIRLEYPRARITHLRCSELLAAVGEGRLHRVLTVDVESLDPQDPHLIVVSELAQLSSAEPVTDSATDAAFSERTQVISR